jgi:alpha-N-arabinofuranosidase
VNNDAPYALGSTSIPGISASAARAKDGKLYVALVNTNPRQATDVTLNVAGQGAQSAEGQVLTAASMDAHNTFQDAKAIKPAPFSAKAADGKLTVKVPAKAVVVVAVAG